MDTVVSKFQFGHRFKISINLRLTNVNTKYILTNNSEKELDHLMKTTFYLNRNLNKLN